MINDIQTVDIFGATKIGLEEENNILRTRINEVIAERDDLEGQLRMLQGNFRGGGERLLGGKMGFEWKVKAPEWLIKGVVPSVGTYNLFGASGAGKSFAAINIALSVATGRNFAGLPVKKGRVAYVVTEGREFFCNRCAGWAQHYGFNVNDPAFNERFMINGLDGQVKLDDPVKLNMLLEMWRPYRPNLIIIDTFTQVLTGSENNQEDVMKIIEAMQQIAKELDCVVIVLDHTGKIDVVTAKGSGAKKDGVDGMLRLTGSIQAGAVFLEASKVRDGGHFEKLVFKPVVVKVKDPKTGNVLLDNFDDPVTTIVLDVATAETIADTVAASTSKKLNKPQRDFIKLLGSGKHMDDEAWDVWKRGNIWDEDKSKSANSKAATRFIDKLGCGAERSLGLIYVADDGGDYTHRARPSGCRYE